MSTGLLTRINQQRRQTATLGSPHIPLPALMLRHYGEHLASIERAILTLLSAFHTPIKLKTLQKVFEMIKTNTAIPDSLLEEGAFENLLARLLATHILSRDVRVDTYVLHPLVSAHYRSQLEASSRPERTLPPAYSLDYDPTWSELPPPPPTDDLGTLIEAVRLACRTGAYDAACSIYLGRIRQVQHGVLTYQMGTYEVNLMLLAEFFPGGDIATLSPQAPEVTTPGTQAWVLNEVGLCLTKLGRLREAESFYQRALELLRQTQDWLNASIGYQNLAHLYIHLGCLEAGTIAASESLRLARIVNHRAVERDALVYSARAAYLYGDLKIAQAAFIRANALNLALIPPQHTLRGLQDLWYVEYLLRAGEIDTAREVIENNLPEEVFTRRIQLDQSRYYRLLGDLKTAPGERPSTGIYNKTLAFYNKALWLAQDAGHLPVLIEALLARGRWEAYPGPAMPALKDNTEMTPPEIRLKIAFNDLEEALSYAIRSEYHRYEVDARVALAWAHLAQSQECKPDNAAFQMTHRKAAWQEATQAQTLSTKMGYYWGKLDADTILKKIKGA
ncbi:MAG: tetratricopeptide repeat protein [Anaerolineae bacterium]|nr:tetratricopeptide repeat protein [Anaerolineae bacterium]